MLHITSNYTLQTLCCSPHKVCDDEGKYNGASPNRAIRNEDGRIQDIIFGPFFICDCSGEEFGSLTDEQVKKYLGMFKLPEYFYSLGGNIQAEKYNPVKDRGDDR